MGLLASADVQLLSEKWRSTVLMAIVVVCVTALGITLSIVTEDVRYGLGAVALIIAIVAKPLALDERKLQKILNEQSASNDVVQR